MMTQDVEATEGRPPLQKRIPGRAEVLAAARQAIDFIEEHPEIPTPQEIYFSTTTHERDEADEATRCEAVVRWAKGNDADLFEGSAGIMATLPILSREQGLGVDISYRWHAHFDKAGRPRYVR